jgi:hypothetical protein
MNRAMLSIKGSKGETTTRTSSNRLRIGEPNDAFEQEADRVADQVMTMGALDQPGWSLSKMSIGVPLQRKCDCGGECDECQKKSLQRKVRQVEPGTRTDSSVPHIVHQVLRSSGQPLDPATRAFMESRFGHDFGQVRLHTDSRAAESTRAVNALAYTVGRDVVFGAGQYQPGTNEGLKLVAHELIHVVQQGNQSQKPIGLRLQRACLPAAQCAAPRATLSEFVADTEKKPENISKAAKRKAACTKVPRDAACTSDGHGAPATALTAILKANYPSRAGFITGIFVDKDIPSAYGAVTSSCASFMPPLPGAQCTFVPDTLEAQGKLYRGGATTIGGKARAAWLTETIGTLTHETEHARFDAAAAIAEPSATACKFADLKSNLSEMAAHLSQMHVYYRDALTRTGKDRFKRFYEMFTFWVTNGSEDISGIVKELRCKCECGDADYYITKTVDSVSTSQHWDSNERFMIHGELRDAKWKLSWPVVPGTVDVNDIPVSTAVPLKFE